MARSDPRDVFPKAEALEETAKAVIERAIETSRVVTDRIGVDVSPSQLVAT